MDPSPALKTYVLDKLQRLEKYMVKPEEIHVIMDVEKIRHQVEITVWQKGDRITGKEVSEDMYSSIDIVADKLERQLKKYKEKLKYHRDQIPIHDLPEPVVKE